MKGLVLRPQAKVALMLGTLCSVCYLAVYFARNILSTVTPQMLADGDFTQADIGTLSSAFFTAYAVGQLINGLVGDRIPANYMISCGLAAAGVGNMVFVLLAHTQPVALAAYGLTGFFLSMIYAPMAKLVAENAEPIYAVRCSVGYSFASFFGSPLAGVTAALVSWQWAFGVASGALVLMGVVGFLLFTVLERRGAIHYGQYVPPAGKGGVRVLLRHRIVPFTLVSMLTGVVRTTVVFWMPTYFVQHLGYTADEAVLIFTIVTLVLSADAFVAIWLYEKVFRRSIDRAVRCYFVVSALAFAGMIVCAQPLVNILLMVLGIFTACAASTILWSCYCPSLRDTGMVSGATGFLDFASYMAASAASTVFAGVLPVIGWRGLIVCWLALMLGGVVVMLPYKKAKQAV